MKKIKNFKDKLNNDIMSSIANYRRMGIAFEIIETDEGSKALTVKITQFKLVNGLILNQRQLMDRGREVFSLSDWTIKYVPVVYSLDTSDITLDWILFRLDEFGIKRKDLIKQLAFDKSSLSLIMSGERPLSNRTRATFFYYFLTYELNRDLRAELSK